MPAQIPVVDLFAGPGGLNEGFSSLRDASGNRIFRTVVSIECEPWAHRTLELRALYRRLYDSGQLSDYYAYARGDILREDLFLKAGALAKEAKDEACFAKLGESDSSNNQIEEKISIALKDFKGSEFVLIGGPPCQAYSTAGRARRKHDQLFSEDEKHFLYKEYLRIVTRFRPAIFLMENVPGLLSAKNKGVKIFEQICSDLGTAGYELHPLTEDQLSLFAADPRRFVVNAERFGVPQTRARVFIVGVRRDLALRPAVLRPRIVDPNTVKDTIGDLPSIRSKLSREADCAHNWCCAIRELGRYQFTNLDEGLRQAILSGLETLPSLLQLGARALRKNKDNEGELKHWLVDRDTEYVFNHNSRAHMASDLRRYFFWAHYTKLFGVSPKMKHVPYYLRPDHKNIVGDLDEVPFKDRFRVQVAGKPSTTVVAHIAKDGHYYIYYKPQHCRSLSVREAARLQTFPDSYFFEGTATDQYRQVGNAVPPFLAAQIARCVHRTLLGQAEDRNTPAEYDGEPRSGTFKNSSRALAS